LISLFFEENEPGTFLGNLNAKLNIVFPWTAFQNPSYSAGPLTAEDGFIFGPWKYIFVDKNTFEPFDFWKLISKIIKKKKFF